MGWIRTDSDNPPPERTNVLVGNAGDEEPLWAWYAGGNYWIGPSRIPTPEYWMRPPKLPEREE